MTDCWHSWPIKEIAHWMLQGTWLEHSMGALSEGQEREMVAFLNIARFLLREESPCSGLNPTV